MVTIKLFRDFGSVVFLLAAAGTGTGAGCSQSQPTEALGAAKPDETALQTPDERPGEEGLKTATFGGGCFWCTEAFFTRLKGVHSVVSGYSGGHVENPTYEQVCTGTTGHAEVIQIAYDPQAISYVELLEVFWKTHDPTTPNRQGADVGPQYRSVVFYHDEQQRRLAERYMAELDASGAFAAPIVTEISPFREFYPAEDYHQQFYETNPNQRYCRYVIRPKMEKFEEVFGRKLKNQGSDSATSE